MNGDTLTLLTNSLGFTQTAETPEGVTVTPFMSTTSDGLAVTLDGGQTAGTFLLGAVSERTDSADSETVGRLTVLGSTSFISQDILAANPSIANQTIFMNALTAGFDDVSNLSIPAKSLAITYNTITNPGLWSTLYMIVLPVLILLFGLIFWMRRRKR